MKTLSSSYISGELAEAIWPEIFHQNVPEWANVEIILDKETPVVRVISVQWPGKYRMMRRDNVTARIGNG